jgi:hypothetical protein
MLFITLGDGPSDGPIGPSPGLADRASDRVNRPGDLAPCVCVGRTPRAPTRHAPLIELISSACPDRANQLCTTRRSRHSPDRVDRPLAHPISRDSAIFRCRSVILLYCQLFCCNELSHFTSLDSAILV